MNDKPNMKALVLDAPGSITLQKVTIPIPVEGEVLIKVKACGICGSDLPRIFGGEAYFYPLIPGHELSGVVVETGSLVDQRWIGKRVTAYPLIPCRRCIQCESARYELCENYGYIGSRRNGGFAQYVCIPAGNCIELPNNVTFEIGALSEPSAVTWHAFKRSMAIPGDRLAVFGLGPMGMLCGAWARLAGCSSVIGIDIDTGKFPLASTFGFDELLDFNDEELVDRISAVNGPRGVNLVIEASGTGTALKEALRIVNRRGNVLMLGNQGKQVIMDPEDFTRILRKEIRIHGTWNSSFNQLESDWVDVFSFQRNGQISLSPLISHRFHLEEGAEALSAMNHRSFSFVKVIITPE